MALTKRQIKILWTFAGFCVSTMFSYSGYFVLVTLQTSINIEEGVGVIGLAVSYVTSTLFGLLVTPVLLRKVPTKYCVFAYQLTYLVYISANFYPAIYTLVPGGVFSGIGEALLLPVSVLLTVRWARKYALNNKGKKDVEAYIMEFTGVFFSAFLSSGILGHAISYGILFSGSALPSPNSSMKNSSLPFSSYSYCGKYDCQDPNITALTLKRYKPPPTVLYTLIGVMAGLVLLGILINVFVLRHVGWHSRKTKGDSQPVETMNGEEMETDMEHQKSVCQMVKETFQHMICRKQLLIIPVTLYYGLTIGLFILEFTRAFASCVLGIEEVSIVIIICAACIVVVSTISTIIASRIGRNIPLFFAALVDTSIYVICLWWEPNADSSWIIYVIAVMIGFSLGIWLPLTNEMHGAYFPDKQEIAFTIWNLFMGLGIAWQATWSTSLCVSTKFYFHLGFLWFSMICHSICLYLNHKEKQNVEKETTTVET